MTTAGDTIRALNRAWTEGRPEATARYLDDDVVFVAPGFSARIAGRQACADSYVQFTTAAELHELTTDGWTEDVTGDTAVVTYRFDVAYTMNDQRHRDTGRDVFVLRRTAKGWRVIWRLMMEND